MHMMTCQVLMLGQNTRCVTPMSSLRDDRVRVPRLNALKFLQWGGTRMVEEEEELKLGDR